MTGWFQVHTEQTVMQHGLPVGTITEGVPLFFMPKTAKENLQSALQRTLNVSGISLK